MFKATQPRQQNRDNAGKDSDKDNDNNDKNGHVQQLRQKGNKQGGTMATMITKPFSCSVHRIVSVTALVLVSVAITFDGWHEQTKLTVVVEEEAKDDNARRGLQSDGMTESGNSSSSELGFPPEWEPVDCEYYTTFQDPSIDPNDGELIARWAKVTAPF